MKLSYLTLGLSLMVAGSFVSAANFSSLGCTKKWYEDFGGMIQKVNVFDKDNRGLLSVRGPEEGLTAHDIQRAEENLGTIFCPGHSGNPTEATGASLIGANDQLVTNRHAFQDDDGSIFDPLSKCVFRQLGLKDKRNAIDHPLNLKDGIEGLKQLQSMGVIKLGNYPSDRKDDYAVVKLKKPIEWVKPYRIERFPVSLHGCKENQLCQRMITISQHQDRLKIKNNKTWSFILQSSDLRGFIDGKNGDGTTLFSDTSATEGSSGSLQFLKDDNGQLVRGSDGELLPIAIVARTMDKSFDGKAYSSKDKIFTLSVGLTDKTLGDIQVMSAKSQTAEMPDGSSLPSDDEGI